SMLKAALLAGVLSFPAALAMDVNIDRQPERVAFIFATTLLGTWGALIAGKLGEGRSLNALTRRALAAGTGAVVGLKSLAFASWVHLGAVPGWDGPIVADATFSGSHLPVTPFSYAAYFGLLSMVAALPSLAVRDRSKRFR